MSEAEFESATAIYGKNNFAISAHLYRAGWSYDQILEAIQETDFANKDVPFFFQHQGIEYFKNSRSSCKAYRGLIGDEMGLGKTAQGLGIVRELIEDGKVILFIVPGATMIQWQKNFDKWILDGEPDDFCTTSLYRISSSKSIIPKGMCCVISHSMLGRAAIVEKLANANFDGVVIDEIHKFGAQGTKRIKHLWALRNLSKSHFESCAIGLSGTPTRNYAKEIYNIWHLIDPERCRTFEGFARDYLTFDHKGLWHPRKFHEDFKDCYLRRTCAEVQKDLPEIRRTELYTEITDPFVIDAYNKELDLMENYLDNAGKVESFSLLGYLIRLRHITGIAKAREPGIIEPLREYLNGEETPNKLILGIHHRAVALRLQRSLPEFKFYMIRGGMSYAEKEQAKQDFISCTAPAILLLSIKAAGEGIDGLQYSGCAKIIVFEQQWNAADETQFEKRLHRTGQKQKVEVENTIATGTVEEFFVALKKQKQRFTTQVEDVNWESNPVFLKTLAQQVVANRLKYPKVEADLEDFENIIKPKNDIQQMLDLGEDI